MHSNSLIVSAKEKIPHTLMVKLSFKKSANNKRKCLGITYVLPDVLGPTIKYIAIF